MMGTIVNTIAVIFGCLIGILLKGGIPEKVSDTIMKALALSVFIIGISGALKTNNILLVIISMVIGGTIGEIIDIDRKLQNFGNKLEAKFKGKGGRVSEAFVTSSLLFCVGAMSIVGALESGLTGNNKTLFAKSILDFVSSIIFTSTLGIGVIFSAVTVFVYQGIITLAASSLREILVSSVITEMTAVGSLLIIAIALSMLGIVKIKVANLLPSVLVVLLLAYIMSLQAVIAILSKMTI